MRTEVIIKVGGHHRAHKSLQPDLFVGLFLTHLTHASSVPTTAERKVKGSIQRSAHPRDGQIPIVSGHKGLCCLYVCLWVSVLVRRRKTRGRPVLSLAPSALRLILPLLL